MTESTVTDWPTAHGHYRAALVALLAEMDRAIAFDEAIGDAMSDDLRTAGLAVLYAPAQHVVHVAQKIRVADSLFMLGHTHPNLAQILVDDLLSLAGLEAGDPSPLP